MTYKEAMKFFKTDTMKAPTRIFIHSEPFHHDNSKYYFNATNLRSDELDVEYIRLDYLTVKINKQLEQIEAHEKALRTKNAIIIFFVILIISFLMYNSI